MSFTIAPTQAVRFMRIRGIVQKVIRTSTGKRRCDMVESSKPTAHKPKIFAEQLGAPEGTRCRTRWVAAKRLQLLPG